MSTTTTYRIDIDGTIARPRFFDEDLRTCCDWYINAGIIQVQEGTSLQHHQQLFLLPHVLITHIPIAGAVEALQGIVSEGKTIQYFTVRQAIDPVVCRMVHGNTLTWLEAMRFPCSSDVSFFWDAGDKLLKSLEAQEDQIILIDDRAAGLVEAYQKIVQKDPAIAQQIQKRVKVLAFGHADIHRLPTIAELNVIPLANWSLFDHVRIDEEKESIDGFTNRTY